MKTKLISFRIDPNLDKLWVAIGLNEIEKAEESKKLESSLIRAYQEFINQTSGNLKSLQDDLNCCHEKLNRIKGIYGDEEVLHGIGSGLSLKEQILIVNSLITEVLIKYQPRREQFSSLFKKIQNIFWLLKVPLTEQREFGSIGEDDFSQNRLDRFKKKLDQLESEAHRRKQIAQSYITDIEQFARTTGDEIPASVQEHNKNGFIDDNTIKSLKDDQLKLKTIQSQRTVIIDDLWAQVHHLYNLLGVVIEDRIQKPNDCTLTSISELHNELEFLNEEKAQRIPHVTNDLHKQIKAICSQMRIPKPIISGKSEEEELIFLRKELDKLQSEFVKAEPILKYLTQLEKLKAISKGSGTQSTLTSRERGSSKRMIEEDVKRREAHDSIPKIESLLLQEFLRFREQNGYDFQIEGVDFINNIQQKKNQTHKQPSSIGKSLLKQKLSEMKKNKPEFISK